jgi:hypothetical protein
LLAGNATAIKEVLGRESGPLESKLNAEISGGVAFVIQEASRPEGDDGNEGSQD